MITKKEIKEAAVVMNKLPKYNFVFILSFHYVTSKHEMSASNHGCVESKNF
jgi:hypothetical protein